TEELVRLGHDVTLFASGDSTTSAVLEAVCVRSLRSDPEILNRDAPLIHQLERAFGAAERFDVIHSHIGFLGFPLARRGSTPVLTTLHGRLDLPELHPVFREFAEIALISISDAQRRPLPDVNWRATIYHGLPAHLYSFHSRPEGYLAFVGRLAVEKRPDH